MRVSRLGLSEASYWRPSFAAEPDAAGHIEETLRASVQRRLEGNPPIALSLSSGLDSSIVAGLMAEQGRPVHAFSIGYDAASYDESRAAEHTAKHFGLDFTRVTCSAESLAGSFLQGIHSTEVATNSLSTTARLQLTKAVRAGGFKALMSGEGADELFGGYPYFGLEAVMRSGDASALERFRQVERHSRGIFWDEGVKGDEGLGWPSVYFARARKTENAIGPMFSRQWLAGMAGRTPFNTAVDAFELDYLRRLTPFNATRVISRGILGAVTIPALGDRVEMANSLEGRVPYLDFELVKLAYRLPESACIDPTTFARKRVLREAFAARLPKGFAPPAKHTLMAPRFADLAKTTTGRELLATLTSDPAVRRAGIFSVPFVKAIKAAWRVWPASRIDLLMGFIVSTQALHSVFIENAQSHRNPVLLPLDQELSPPALGRIEALAS